MNPGRDLKMIPWTPHRSEVSGITLLAPSTQTMVDAKLKIRVNSLCLSWNIGSVTYRKWKKGIYHLYTSHIHGDRFWFQFTSEADKEMIKKGNKNNNPSKGLVALLNQDEWTYNVCHPLQPVQRRDTGEQKENQSRFKSGWSNRCSFSI